MGKMNRIVFVSDNYEEEKLSFKIVITGHHSYIVSIIQISIKPIKLRKLKHKII